MKKWIIAALAAALVLTGCGTAKQAQSLKKITLSEVAHSVFYAPQYAALTQGFFKEEGLDVEMILGNGADKVMTAVVSGQVDIGLSGPEQTIYVYNEGRKDYAVTFAQLTKRDGSFLVGREPVKDFSWEIVRGRTILGGRKGGVPEMTLEYVLRKNGVEPNKDVVVDTSVQFAVMGGAFTGGQGDFVTLFEPTASAVEREGKGVILCSIGEESGEIPYTCYYAAKSYMEKNADVIEKFTRGIYKGQKWVAAHTPREVAEAIAPFFAETDIDLLETVCRRHMEIDAFAKNPVLGQEAFDRLQTVIEQAGELDKRADYKTLVNTSFAEKAIKDLG
jgi:NitT/TauT family transport system substrate-binding protein